VAQVSGSGEQVWLRDTVGNVRSLSTSAELSAPVAVPLPAADLSAGYYGACAVLVDGSVYCWASPGFAEKDLGIELPDVPERVQLCP
jgi:hypothetical protein